MQLTRCVIPVAVLLVGCGGEVGPQISISRGILQKAVERGFPLSNASDQDAKVIVELTDPEVLLEDGRNQVGIKVVVTAEPAGQPPVGKLRPKAKFGERSKHERVTGTVSMFGDLSYNAEQQAFFYQNPSFEDVALDLPAPLAAPAREIIPRLLAKYLQENPVYKLEGDDAATQAAGKLLRGITVRDGHVYVQLGM